MLSSLECDWRAQAYGLVGRRFQKEVTSVQAPGEAEKPPSHLGRKTLEGRVPESLGSPSSSLQFFLQPRVARVLWLDLEEVYVEVGRWQSQVRRC